MTEQIERRDNWSVIALVTEIHKDVKDLRLTLENHMQEETHELAAAVAKLILEGFPEGDPDGHRKAHEAAIIKAQASAEFWRKMSFEITKGGLLAFLAWGCFALWRAFLEGPAK